jgi:hypothetical protein
VEVLGYCKIVEYITEDRRLGGPSMVSIEVAEGDEVISLIEL